MQFLQKYSINSNTDLKIIQQNSHIKIYHENLQLNENP